MWDRIESRRRTGSPWPMVRLVATVCVLLVAAGCSKKAPAPEPYTGASVLDEERGIVNDVVPDSARRADILAILDQAEARMRRYTEESAPYTDSLRVLFRSRDATDDQLLAVYRAYGQVRVDAARDFVQYQLAIREITFPNEWKAINGRDNAMLGN